MIRAITLLALALAAVLMLAMTDDGQGLCDLNTCTTSENLEQP